MNMSALIIFTAYYLIIRIVSCDMRGNVNCKNYHVKDNKPHEVYLELYCGIHYWLCQGTILNEKIILTAAMCLADCDIPYHKVIANVGTQCKFGRPYRVVKYILHPNFNPKQYHENIALALLEENLTFNEYVQRASIMFEPPIGAFGEVKRRNRSSTSKQRLVPVLENIWEQEDCDLHINYKQTDGFLCGGNGTNLDYSSLPGSGLVIDDYILVGIANYVMGADRYKGVTIYTNVGYYLDWITKTSEELYCTKELPQKKSSTLEENDTTTTATPDSRKLILI